LALLPGCGALLGIDQVEYRDAGADSGLNTPSQDATTTDAPSADSAPVVRPDGPTQDGGIDAMMPIEASLPPDAAVPDASHSPPTSCLATGNGLSNCGTNSESCCTTLVVDGGTFNRTYQSLPDGGPYAESNPAMVSTFRLDKYEITVGRFRQYVNYLATGKPPANGSGIHTHLNHGLGVVGDTGSYESGWDATGWNVNVFTGPSAANAWNNTLNCDSSYATWTPDPGSGANETLPIDCINWWQAYAFCIWDGGFLPTEAEWEYAAAGGSDQREYPWGGTDPGTANAYAIFGCNFGGGGSCSGLVNIAPVGTASQGLGRWGQIDQAGSLWEWNLDYYANGSVVTPCQDCAYLTETSYRVFPGGSYSDQPTYLAASIPYTFTAPSRLNNIGARCARSP
jgi:formylglycine-generating enzyme required for sulfatase activity